jgi:hypothetical protein
MFSRRVVSHTLDSFVPLYEQMIVELSSSRFGGDQAVAHNMELNLDVRAYHAYSFQTVRESDSRLLLREFIDLPVGAPKETRSARPSLRAAAARSRS